MITAIVERRFQREKTEDVARLLVELRRRMMQQIGCISSETLCSANDPSLWVNVSTWTYSDQLKSWETTPQYKEIQSELEKILTNSEKVSIFNIVK